MPQEARTVITQVNAPHLLIATDKLGNLLDPSALNRTAGGMIGSYGGGSLPLNQARFHKAGADSIRAVSQMPYDPTALFAAAAIAQINQKLDSIQRSVNELYAYARQRDKSRIRANIQTLSVILANYDVNCGNATYIANAHMKALDVRQESRTAIDLNRERAQASLSKTAPLEIRASVERRLDQALDCLGEYRLALFAFSFATFLEPCSHRTSHQKSSGPAHGRSRRSRCDTESSTRAVTTPSRRLARAQSMPRFSAARPQLQVASATPSKECPWVTIPL